MKKYLILVPFLFFSVLDLMADILSEPMATVNLIRPEIITVQEVDAKIEEFNQQMVRNGLGQKDISRETMLDSIISSVLIKQAAERDGINVSNEEMQKVLMNQKASVESQLKKKITDEQFRQIINNQFSGGWDMYLQDLKEQVLQQTYITNKKKTLFENIRRPSDQEILNKYNENTKFFFNPEYIRVSMIFIPALNMDAEEKADTRKKLTEVYNQLKNGSISFDAAVLKYSEEENSKYKGGDIGYINRDNRNLKLQLGEEFFNNMFSLEKNQISKVLESNAGFHIYKITDKIEPRLPSVDEPLNPATSVTVREYLINGMIQEKQQQVLQQAIKEINTELRKQAEIVIF